MASRKCMLAKELKDIEREKFEGLLAKRQIWLSMFSSVNKLCYTIVNLWST